MKILASIFSAPSTASMMALIASCAIAQDLPVPVEDPVAPPIDESIWGRDALLGDAFGVRPWLAERGMTFEAVLIADFSRNLSGGRNHAGTARHLLDIGIEADLHTMLGLDGATAFLDLQTQEGQDGSVETGDLQAYSNIDADDFTAIYELWYQQEILDGRVRLKAGKIDVNTEFAFVDNADEFIHSSPGFSPTIFTLPTYPDPAFGALAFVGQGGGFYAGVGLFDGALQEGIPTGTRGPKTLFGRPADLFLIGEGGYAWGGEQLLRGRFGVGLWHHTGNFATFGGGNESGTSGFYAVFNQQLNKEHPAPDDDQGLYLFAQYGYADERVSAVEHHVGGGLQWAGPIPGRDEDVAGLMMSYASLSGEPGSGFTEDSETAIELFYKAQLTPWLSVKPDLQYIVNPGGAGLDDAWVGTLRMEINF